jgi:hypothetical protein
VINVGVREDHHIDAGGIKMREAAIDLILVVASPLIEPTIEEDPLTVHFQQMLGPRRRAGCAAKFQFHGKISEG